jgi:hypothetical protein
MLQPPSPLETTLAGAHGRRVCSAIYTSKHSSQSCICKRCHYPLMLYTSTAYATPVQCIVPTAKCAEGITITRKGKDHMKHQNPASELVCLPTSYLH